MRTTTWLAAMALLLTGAPDLRASDRTTGDGEPARRALVIGNADYAESPLNTPATDAHDVAKALRDLGFGVVERNNLTRDGIATTLAKFARIVHPGDVSFVFYSGRALQRHGENYLIPVDFDPTSGGDLGRDLYPLANVMATVKERGPSLSVVVLDAGFANPFKRTGGVEKGLAPVSRVSDGTLLVFGTSPGHTADDGEAGMNSAYTRSLLSLLGRSGLDVEALFRAVRDDVTKKTSGSQVPWSAGHAAGTLCPGGVCEVSTSTHRDAEAHGRTAMGRIRIVSNPTGATVSLDGEPAGKTTLKKSVEAGSHQLTINLHGYQPVEKKITVDAGKETYDMEYLDQLGEGSGAAHPSVDAAKIEAKSGLEFVHLAGGTFHYGCEPQDTQCASNEKPGHPATVAPFWIGKTDVTVESYKKCLNAGACTEPTRGGDCNWGVRGRDKHPLNCIDWDQATAFCEWIGGRLPTSEEWEFAAKGGESRVYPWGDESPDVTRARYGEKSTAAPEADGGGASKHGLLDMAGNLWQWIASKRDADYRELRGGSWYGGARDLRASGRMVVPGSYQYTHLTGARCALQN